MPVNIQGNQYFTVAERVAQLHQSRNGERVYITTTITEDTPEQVVVRATVTCDAGIFTGHAHSKKAGAGIESRAPLEVAETSAVGRALGFAGFGSAEGIASADEMQAYNEPTTQKPPARKPTAHPAPPKPPARSPEKQRAPKAPPAPAKPSGDDDGRSALFGLATEMWRDKDAHAAICAALSLPSDGEGAITEHWLDKGGTYKGAQTYLAEVRRTEVGGKSFEDACRIVNAFAQLTVTE